MNTLYIAIGNSLRGDDGVAHCILERLQLPEDAIGLRVLQLTPELAPEVARAETVIFIDADIDALSPSLDPVQAVTMRGNLLAHHLTPGEILCLAERLYGFAGRAWLCRVPVSTFAGERLSPFGEAAVENALTLLREEIPV